MDKSICFTLRGRDNRNNIYEDLTHSDSEHLQESSIVCDRITYSLVGNSLFECSECHMKVAQILIKAHSNKHLSRPQSTREVRSSIDSSRPKLVKNLSFTRSISTEEEFPIQIPQKRTRSAIDTLKELRQLSSIFSQLNRLAEFKCYRIKLRAFKRFRSSLSTKR